MAHILIIDDDKSILRLLEFTLQRAGHTVSTYSDAAQGLTQSEQQHPDLIVLDVMMPQMNGYEFCRQARQKPPLAKTPILMFSARYQSIDRKAALESGATDYLAKTTSPNDLLKRIAEMLATQPEVIEGEAIGIFSLRGGAGVTSLAINLATHIAQTDRSTILLDLAQMGGHAALMLGLHPTSSVGQALTTLKSDHSADGLKPHLTGHASGLQLLASIASYDDQLFLTDERLTHLMDISKSAYQFTILDIPHSLEANFAPTLQRFDNLILMLTPDRPSLHSTRITLQGLVRFGIPDDKINLVINQTFPQNALSLETIQDTLKRSVTSVIPFDPEMINATNEGQPLVSHSPTSPASQAIIQLAGNFIN